MMYDALINEYGYDPVNIHVLFGSNPELAPGFNTYEATYTDLKSAFGQISLNMNPFEEFFFWSFDHGTQVVVPTPSALILGGTGLVTLVGLRRKRLLKKA